MKLSVTLILSVVMSLGAGARTDTEMYFCDGFFGATLQETKTETVVYDSKDESEDYEIKYKLPCYHNKGAYDNTCANVAGAIILGFYDKDYDELIPGFTSARIIRDTAIYKAQNSAIQAVIDDLYVRMGTNMSSAGGTSVSGFKNGLASYVESRGRSIAFSHVGGDKAALVSAFDNLQPVALFVNGYVMTDMSGYETGVGTDKYYKSYYSGAHLLVAYGYKEVKYYDVGGNMIKNMTVLKVATGFDQPLSYVITEDFMQIEDGYAVNIY